MMHPQLFPISRIFIAIVALIRLPASLAQSNEQYLSCNRPFQCGNVQGIGYPFWGGNRSEFCGHPSFSLNCTGEAPVLTIQTRPYRVLSIDNVTFTLTAVRQEFWQEDCPQYLRNATLNETPFSYALDADELFLYYGCMTLITGTINITNKFPCTEGTFGIYALSGHTNYVSDGIVGCNITVSLEVKSTVGAGLASNSSSEKLAEVLDSGVGLVWEANNTNCQRCVASGGVCGSNSSNPGSFVCHCSDRDDAVSCGSSHPGSENKSSFGRKLGIGFGSVLVVGVVTTLALFWYFGRNFSIKSFIFWNNRSEVHAKLEAILNNCGHVAPKIYSYSEVKKMTNSFKEKLGQGGYGLVYKGKLKNGNLIAVKVLKESKGNGDEFINEVTSISRTAHTNVVTLLGFCFEGRKRALIYEFMPNGSLDKFLSDTSLSVEHQLGWGTLYLIAIGIARGLEYLHRGCNTRILHLDIKPHNILLDEGFCPKISDFGLAKLCSKKNSIISLSDKRGTAGYIAPEIFSRIYGGVSHKSDVYSYGMMIINMVGGRNNVDFEVGQTTEYFPDWLYRSLEMDEEIGQHGNMNEAETEISRKMTMVGLWCIQIDPSSRPAMSKVVEMLDGSLASLQIPPRPFLASLQTAPVESSSTDNLESGSSNI